MTPFRMATVADCGYALLNPLQSSNKHRRWFENAVVHLGKVEAVVDDQKGIPTSRTQGISRWNPDPC